MSHKYNILYIESGTSGGGSFESLYQGLKGMNRRRFRPVVVYLNNNPFIERVKALGMPVYLLTDRLYSNHVQSLARGLTLRLRAVVDNYLPALYLAFARLAHKSLVASLEDIIRKEKIDIIHLNVQTNRDLFGLFVAEKTGVPCISHLRSMRSGGFDRRRAGYANRVVSVFIANSESTKQHWKNLGIDENKIQVVYNAINKTGIKPVTIHETWGIDKSARFIIGCASRLAGGKGHSFLLNAFSEFVKRRPDTVLLLIGDGPLRDELGRQAAKLAISDRVIFTGYLGNAQDVIAGLDLLVLASEAEPFGRVLIEAMQCGTAIVATDSGGVSEVVQHEHNGLLVSYGDHEGLRRAMERLLTDEQLRSRLIQNGLRTLEERFDMKNYLDEMERIYGVVSGKRRTSTSPQPAHY